MAEKLLIPTTIQSLINEIEDTPLNMGSIPISKHPKLDPSFNREIEIVKLTADLSMPRIYIGYRQVITDSEGKKVPSNLPTPEWAILEEETTVLKDENFQTIKVPLVEVADDGTEQPILNEDGTPKLEPIHVSTHSYLVWLIANHKAGLFDLLKGYLAEKLKDEEFVDKLNKLA